MIPEQRPLLKTASPTGADLKLPPRRKHPALLIVNTAALIGWMAFLAWLAFR